MGNLWNCRIIWEDILMAKTATIKVEIDKSQVDEWAKKRIEELEHQLGLAEKREKRAKGRISELEADAETVQSIIELAKGFTRDLDGYVDAVYKDYA
jgi:ABC-type Fe2+-enterobactin transport system substrate-binding protein